jgi:hypothetical protein
LKAYSLKMYFGTGVEKAEANMVNFDVIFGRSMADVLSMGDSEEVPHTLHTSSNDDEPERSHFKTQATRLIVSPRYAPFKR